MHPLGSGFSTGLPAQSQIIYPWLNAQIDTRDLKYFINFYGSFFKKLIGEIEEAAKQTESRNDAKKNYVSVFDKFLFAHVNDSFCTFATITFFTTKLNTALKQPVEFLALYSPPII